MKSPRPSFWLILALVVCRPALLPAQNHAGVLAPGDRIRFVAPPRYPTLVESSLVRLDTDTLHAVGIRSPGQRFHVPLGDLQRLELRETRRNTLLGAGIGGGVGLLASVLFLSGFCNEGDSPCSTDDHLKGGLLITIPPAVVGGIVGSIVKSHEWVPVRTNRDPRAGDG